jgi:hypothetical protein
MVISGLPLGVISGLPLDGHKWIATCCNVLCVLYAKVERVVYTFAITRMNHPINHTHV